MAVSYSSSRKLIYHVFAENKEILSHLFIFVPNKLKSNSFLKFCRNYTKYILIVNINIEKM